MITLKDYQSRDTPPHGDHPWHVGHVDHTELDIRARHPFDDEKTLRPWLTTLILAFSRLVVAYWLTFSKPNTESILMVMRLCLKKWGRLPQVFVFDGGKEMSGNTIALTQATFRFTSQIRPPHHARSGSVLESKFHSLNCHLVHNLPGNTKITKNVRQVTKSNNPQNLAKLSLSDLDDRLRHYFDVVTPNVDHPALLTTPKKAHEEGLSRMGPRSHLYFPYTKETEMFLSPLVEGGTRVISPNGVKVDSYHYFHPRLLAHIGEEVEVRRELADCRIAYVKIGSEMVVCECRIRWPLLDRFPGHEASISQVVVDSQREILALRGHQIHAAVGGFEPSPPLPQGNTKESEPVGVAEEPTVISDPGLGDPSTENSSENFAAPAPATGKGKMRAVAPDTVFVDFNQDDSGEDEMKVIKL